jgi:hypothetical protein
MNKSMEIVALVVCLAQNPVSLAAAQARRAPHSSPSGAIGTRQTDHAVPDWTVQYGRISNPRGASGSFGAMLEGRNPAAGAIP